MSSCTTLYVEEVLTEHFGRLLTFIKKAETAQKMRGAGAAAADGGGAVPGYGAAEAQPIVAEFSAKWSGAIDALHK